MSLLIITTTSRGPEFLAGAREAGKGLDIRIWPDVGDPADIRYALAWLPPKGELKKLPNLQMIVSVGAGVDHLLGDPELPDAPVVRYVDPDLTGRMAEYIGLQVLFHQRRMSEYLECQDQRKWTYLPEPAAHEVRVGIMGLGVMGLASLNVLKPFGYQLRGWSRTRHEIPGVVCFAGRTELDTFLAESDIVACVLPQTPDTKHILNADLISKMSLRGRHPRMPGPVLINAGRGGLQNENDIIATLDSGKLYAASLDVFETEPLPQDSPLWRHPRVVVTPHNAAESTARSITRYFLRQVHAHMRGEPVANIVDRTRGY